MSKLSLLILITLLLSGCSLTRSSKLWNNDKTQVNEPENIKIVLTNEASPVEEFNSNIEIERQTTNVDKIVQQLKLPSSKIAVIDQNHQVKTEDFLWVFKDLKEVGKQPFLQVKKETEKPKTKPESKSPKEDELEDFTEVTKDTQKS